MRTQVTRALMGAFLTFGATSSCMNKPDLSSDNGVEVAASAVQNAMVEAWGDGDALDIGDAEFMSLDVSRSIPDYPNFYLRQYSQQVDGCGENASKRIYAVIHNRVDNPAGAQPTTYPPARLGWEIVKSGKGGTGFSATSMPQRSLSEVSQHPLGFALYFIAFLPMCSEKDTKCYNLVTTSDTIAAPPAIASQPNCAGIPNCRIRRRIVMFDAIFTTKDPNTGTTTHTKQQISLKLAPGLPILSRLQEFCMSGIENDGSVAYPYMDCYSVTNFRRGTPAQCQAIP